MDVLTPALFTCNVFSNRKKKGFLNVGKIFGGLC